MNSKRHLFYFSARHCISLEDFVVKVALPSLLTVCKCNGGMFILTSIYLLVNQGVKKKQKGGGAYSVKCIHTRIPFGLKPIDFIFVIKVN